jgi:hypothetical protein
MGTNKLKPRYATFMFCSMDLIGSIELWCKFLVDFFFEGCFYRVEGEETLGPLLQKNALSIVS